MKWCRSLAVCVTTAVGISLIPAGSPPASASGLLVVGQTVRLPYTTVAPLSILFQPITSGITTNQSAKVVFAGYLSVGGNFNRVLTGQDLNTTLAVPFRVEGPGEVTITVTALFNGRAVSDTAMAYVDVLSAPTTTLASAAPTTTPAPVNPAPAPVNPAPAPVHPAPAPVNPAPAPPAAPVTGNQPPTAVGKSAVVKKNTATAVVLKGTDPERAPLVYSVADFPEHGRLTGRAPNLTYKPDSGFVGTDAFTFTVSDGVSTSEPAAVSITVISTKAVVRKVNKKKK